jgi:hypothetical protein
VEVEFADEFSSSRSFDSPRLLLHLHGTHEDKPVHQQRASQRLGKSGKGSFTPPMSFCASKT